MLFAGLYLSWGVFALAVSGKETVGIVEEYKPYKRYRVKRVSRTYHYHNLLVDGHVLRIDLGEQVPLGTRLYVVYLPNDPTNAVSGRKEASAWEFIKKRLSYAEAFFSFVGIIILWNGWSWTKDIKHYNQRNGRSVTSKSKNIESTQTPYPDNPLHLKTRKK